MPVVSAEDGQWVAPQAMQPMLKPGGHGALWKLMHDTSTFAWLAARDCQAALVRQISNPLAGTDTTMLGLAGAGYADGRSFGFAACERAVGAAEGINVVLERRMQQPGSQASPVGTALFSSLQVGTAWHDHDCVDCFQSCIVRIFCHTLGCPWPAGMPPFW